MFRVVRVKVASLGLQASCWREPSGPWFMDPADRAAGRRVNPLRGRMSVDGILGRAHERGGSSLAPLAYNIDVFFSFLCVITIGIYRRVAAEIVL